MGSGETLVRYLAFLFHMTRQDLLERYSGSVMGPLWALFMPLMQVAIFIIVFGTLMAGRLPGQSSTSDYGIYLIAGILPWTAFTSTMIRLSTVFIDRKPILGKVGLPLPVVAAPIALSEGLTLSFGLIFLVVFAIVSGRGSAALLAVPLIIVLQQVLALAIGTAMGAFTVFIRDIHHFAGILFQLWFWMTPIVYVPEILPAWARPIAMSNPALIFIAPYQDAFLKGVVDYRSIALLLVTGIVLGGISWRLVGRLERDIRDSI